MPQIANGETGASARAKINAVLPQTVSFATAVPLDGRKVMAAQAIAGGLAFTPAASPVIGGECYVCLTADGTHAPTFAGFTEHGSSAGFFNSAGVMNTTRFWFDGTTSWFAIAQALNVVPLVMQSAAIANATPTQIQVTFGVAMNTAATPAASAFTVTNSGGIDTVSGVTWTNSTTLTLTKSRTTLAADATISLAYAPPGSNALVDANGNAVAGSTIAVTNNVAAAGGSTSFVQMASLTRFTEAAHSGGGWDYTPTSSDYGSAGFATAIVKLAANTDGGFAVTLNAPAGDGPMLGLTVNAGTLSSINGISYAMYAGTGVGGAYSIWAAGSTPAANGTATNCASGDKLRAYRTGSSIAMQVQRSGSSTWITVHTFSGASTGILYPAIACGSSGAGNVITTPVGYNVA